MIDLRIIRFEINLKNFKVEVLMMDENSPLRFEYEIQCTNYLAGKGLSRDAKTVAESMHMDPTHRNFRIHFYSMIPQEPGKVYYLFEDTVVSPDDIEYWFFLLLKARVLAREFFWNIRTFLSYQMYKSFPDEKKLFLHFLKTAINKFRPTVLQDQDNLVDEIHDFCDEVMSQLPKTRIIPGKTRTKIRAFEDIFEIDLLFKNHQPQFLKIEMELLERKFIEKHETGYRWQLKKRTANKSNIVAYILLLRHYKYFNPSVFDRGKNYLLYRKAFELRYYVELTQYFTPQKIKHFKAEDYAITFSFISDPEPEEER